MNRNSGFVYLLAKTMQLLLTPIAKIRFRGKNVWILTERGYDARDNGYHMFLYLRKHHPEIEAWYLISRNSPDLSKISDLGNIVYLSSKKYWLLYLSASVLMGAFEPVVPSGNIRFGKELKKKNHQKYIFLQHGIIGNDLPVYHQENATFDLFFCGAKPEYEFVSENFHYKNGEVRYTGLARFDSLHNVKTQRSILIMPTWRRWIAGLDSEDVAKSEYFLRWNSLINNPELIRLSEQYNCKIIFYPHALMQKYADLFSSPGKNIIIGRFDEYDVQTLLKESSLLITDYSSVNFDFAYMNKPVLYYQFDTEKFFQDHVGAGWFDYKTSGFGECLQIEDDLLNCIEQYVASEFRMKPEYEQRIRDVFPLHDDHNCERIYQEIINTFDHSDLF